MRESMHELLSVLDLEQLDSNLFRGRNENHPRKRVFGGQVLGQALIAAARTVEGRVAHSLHAYFLRPGDMTVPIIYDVERIRDGNSFTTRRVVAIQRGTPIFTMGASFQVREEGVEHQDAPPPVPAPESLETDHAARLRAAARLPEPHRDFFVRERPFEVRPVQAVDFLEPGPQPPHRDFWMRATDPLPDDEVLHQALAAYLSDFNLLGSALLPHGLTFWQKNLQTASLDHAMWFHRPVRVDQWLLYATESPSAANSRGFTRGDLFDQSGRLVASVAQEGLVRLRD